MPPEKWREACDIHASYPNDVCLSSATAFLGVCIFPKFGGCDEWHCRLRGKDLRRSASAAAAQTVGVAHFANDSREHAAGRHFLASTRFALGAGPSPVYDLARFETFLESLG